MMKRFDTFSIEEMSAKDYAKKQAYVIKNCQCAGCPTYLDGDTPVGYCFPLIGTSRMIKIEKDCICARCPIYREYELSHTFYCTRCSQVCQAYKAEIGVGP